MSAPGDEHDEARRLRAAWDERGRSAGRDFYVASHPGWDDPQRRLVQARVDADMLLHGLTDRLSALDVLEIGCGVGRLAALIAPRARSYTGLDIAPSMLAEARARHGALAGARFLECDGLGVPAAARDRSYGLVFAHAVLIHCPRAVCAAWLASALDVLAPGGELRCQLRADPSDPGGLAAAAPAAVIDVWAQQAEAAARPVELELALPPDYMGHAFGWEDAQQLVREVARGPADLLRLDPAHLYIRIVRPA